MSARENENFENDFFNLTFFLPASIHSCTPNTIPYFHLNSLDCVVLRFSEVRIVYLGVILYIQVNNKPHVQIKPTKDHAKSYAAF